MQVMKMILTKVTSDNFDPFTLCDCSVVLKGVKCCGLQRQAGRGWKVLIVITAMAWWQILPVTAKLLVNGNTRQKNENIF